MAELMMVKTAFGFKPADDQSDEAMKSFKFGDVIKMKVTKPRNGKHHRKYWALCKLVSDNTDNGWKPDEVDYLFKVATGHCDMITDTKGNIHKRPKSISYASMDQVAFNAFYDQVIDLVCKHIIPGMDESDLRQELENITLSY